MNRNHFIKSIGHSGLVVAALPLMSFKLPDGEKLDTKIVQEFVRVSHSDIDKVKTLLEEYPTLLNAAHDWNQGDFETGLGAASHVGHKELAKFLLEQGAQANIFTACLFGKMEVVKPMLTAFPKTLHAKGPHGFTLLHHAIKGGNEALKVKEYLTFLGATETKVTLN
jgi:hypothetical protein